MSWSWRGRTTNPLMSQMLLGYWPMIIIPSKSLSENVENKYDNSPQNRFFRRRLDLINFTQPLIAYLRFDNEEIVTGTTRSKNER